MRTHTCGDLRKDDEKKKVTLCGWAERIRVHGNVLFVDLRDRYGTTQIVFDESLKEQSVKLKKEFVLSVTGDVKLKPEPNKKLKTGDIELHVTKFTILNESEPLPLDLEDYSNMTEDTRLKWRYLDLRRESMQRNLLIRHKLCKTIRDFFDKNGFIDIETPILAKSTPEGARDYLVPSRVNPGKFYALPQSPQIFKQLLMIAGMDRYFQIVKCLRDEDLRGDRQPEFTQLDIEMSFIREDELFALLEGLMKKVWKEVLDVNIGIPFKRMTYAEAMDRYGSDKPDLRFGFELVDVKDIIKNSSFEIFTKIIESGGCVKCINAKGCFNFSRKEIKALENEAKAHGAGGLAWVKIGSEWEGPLAKFLKPDIRAQLAEKTGAKQGDLLLFVGDHKHYNVNDSLGNLRNFLAKKLNLVKPDVFDFVWIVDFPLLEYDEDQQRHIAVHHPFTSPHEEDIHLLEKSPEKVRSRAYDLALNGIELGGGSIRIHRRDLQEKMFNVLGLTKDEVQQKFGFFLNAFKYGAPPHGGIAFGIDRWSRILAGQSNIREVIAFPKTKNAEDLMMDSPSGVSDTQLDELNLKLK